jgi:hypothetical protein
LTTGSTLESCGKAILKIPPKNGKVKRRISISKDKLRSEASQVIPTVLEDKQKVAENKEKLMNSIRVLAGVSGNKTFV